MRSKSRRTAGLRYQNVALMAGLVLAGGGVLWGQQAVTPPVGFPIAGANPWTAPIISVLDHSAVAFYDKTHTSVTAYTGETGDGPCGPSGQPCGYYNAGTTTFLVNGAYTGTSADGANARKVLNYRGHSGYDYGYALGTPIVAAADGVFYIPAQDPVNGSDPWCSFHTFYIDHGGGWTTWYLHAADLAVPGAHHDCSASQPSIAADERIADVRRGQTVATVGKFGVNGPHLHFEVRKNCVRSGGGISGCQVVDPYGWEWTGGDPIVKNPLAAAATAPLWDLAALNLLKPSIIAIQLVSASGGYDATVTGTGFSAATEITLWDRAGGFWVATARPASVNTAGTQILVNLPAKAGSGAGGYVVKAGNPEGPRSAGFTVSTGPTFDSGEVVNSANYGDISPGALATVFGSNFAAEAVTAASIPLPGTLAGVAVTLNGIQAPLLYADTGQINFQVPWEIAPGNASVVVTVNGQQSQAVNVPVRAVAPGLFITGGDASIPENRALVLNSDFTLNGKGNPAKAGSFLVAFVTGAGPVNPAVASGAAGPSNPLSFLTYPATATIGPAKATVTFAGLAPGYVGVTQVNLTVPPGMASGDYVLSVTVNGQTSNANTISVTGDGTTSYCAPFPADFIPFSLVYAVSGTNTAGDRLLTGAVSRANYGTIQSLPLPNQPNQQFCGTVTLANGYTAVAYVPTAAERAGNFSADGIPIIDPLTKAPFPGNIIPASRLPDPFAWRIAGTGGTVPAPVQLSVAMSHAGNFTQGQSGAVYSVTVSNPGTGAATTGTVTATEAIPLGLTLVSMAGQGWTCSASACTRSDGLAAGASYPPITVTVNVLATAAGSVTNKVTVSGGGSSSAVSASDATTVLPRIISGLDGGPWPTQDHDNQRSNRSGLTGPASPTAPRLIYDAGGPILNAMAVTSDGKILLGGCFGERLANKVVAIDATGKSAWTAPFGLSSTNNEGVQGFTVDAAGHIDVAIHDCPDITGPVSVHLYSLLANGSSVVGWPIVFPATYEPAAIGADGTIYQMDELSRVFALRPGDGAVIWRQNTAGYSHGAIALDAAGNLYIGTDGGDFGSASLWSFTPGGTVRWSQGKNILSTPAISASGSVYVASLTGTVYAYNTSGALIAGWPASTGSTTVDDGKRHPLAVASTDAVYVKTVAGLFVFNPDGTLKWKFSPGGDATLSGSVILDGGDNAYVAFGNAVYSLTPSGTVRWVTGMTSPGNLVAGGPGVLYVISANRQLYAIQ